ncbi:hypothetical protein [Chondromyces crocatus]|uniref:Band 7 domain-containing protein n=1 Tax=Chondromyces crocatus TaxID=52 RepID=A0A0K1EU72_CHOCO|nr:hypothetical protein [Chondromyces crocatus]AKT44173.1 uncharacterized protein CMC5_084130 [Chondromyces crocatus]
MLVPSRLALVFGAALLVACGGGGGSAPDAGVQEEEHQPLVRFESYVYVEPGASDFVIVERVRQQVLSVFPALRQAHVLVSKREVPGVKTEVFEREAVEVVDTALDAHRTAMRVRYRYLTRADVSRTVEGREQLELAVLHRTRGPDARRIVRECTALDPEDRRSQGTIALDFNATLAGCKKAIQEEQGAIDTARAKLTQEGVEKIPIEELNRLYLPVKVVLESPPTGAPLGTFPRYEAFGEAQAAEMAQAQAAQTQAAQAQAAQAQAAQAQAAQAAQAAQLAQAAQQAPSGYEGSRAGGMGGPSKDVDPWSGPMEHERAVAPVEPQGHALGASAIERLSHRDESDDMPREPAPPREPGMSVPRAPAPPGPPRSVRHEETMGERFESIFDQLFQARFLAVWASLLLMIPVLMGERKKKPTPE